MNETIAREQVAKIAAKQAATGGTTNQRDFAEWLLEASGYVARTEKERAAFLAGAMLAVPTYKVFQAAKPSSSQYVAPEPTKKPAARKPRAKKAAPAAVAEAGETA